MKIITNKDEFKKRKDEIQKIINNNRLPEQVFKTQFRNFIFIDLDNVFTEVFFDRIKTFLTFINEQKCFLAVIDPEPEEYFFKHFKKYPVIEIYIEDTAEDYLTIIQEDPGQSPADAIAYNSTVLILFSESLDWAIYGDRDFELGIVGFRNEKFVQAFTSAYGKADIFNVNEAITDLLEVVYSNIITGVPEEIRNQLVKNYKGLE